jgi:hypothetical protein
MSVLPYKIRLGEFSCPMPWIIPCFYQPIYSTISHGNERGTIIGKSRFLFANFRQDSSGVPFLASEWCFSVYYLFFFFFRARFPAHSDSSPVWAAVRNCVHFNQTALVTCSTDFIDQFSKPFNLHKISGKWRHATTHVMLYFF